MPYEIITCEYADDVVEWLQVNIGELLWSRPNIEWRGKGWTINAYGIGRSQDRMYYLVKVDDAKMATLAALKFR